VREARRILSGIALSVALAGSAHAAFPGANGKIAFSSDASGNPEIYVMNPDGTGLTNLTNHPGPDSDPAWSADGTTIAFRSGRSGSYDVWVMNADGSSPTQLTTDLEDDGFPAWSPDGSKIAFQSHRDGNSEIYVMNADGTAQTRLTFDPADDLSPAWSPDGSKIAFISKRDGDDHVYTMAPDGSNVTQITFGPATEFFPTWSPDGAQLLCISGFGTYDLLVMNADGSNPAAISTGLDVNTPAWSPDGTAIAFVANSHVFTVHPDGTGLTQVTNGAGEDYKVDWQPLPNGGVTATTTTIDAASVQYSDHVALTAHVGPSGATGSVEFFVGGASVGTSSVASGIATLGYTTLLPMGGYELVAVFTSDGASYASSTSDLGAGSNPILTVLREDATVTPSVANAAQVKVGAPGGTASFDLTASITDAADGYPGNVCLAGLTIALAPVGPGSGISIPATQVSCSGVGGTRVMKASFANVPVNVYDVTFTVTGNYYTGSASSVVAVYDPSLGFTTGGGHVVDPNTGNVADFGFNVKYQKKGGAQGQLLYIEHTANGDVVVKSNAMGSLSIVTGPPMTAIFLGKATVAGVGNQSFQCTVEDNGEPGNKDRFALKITGNATYTFPLTTIAGGNIPGPHK
jgi:hypothetical protein